jgi:hypothetical protein
MAEIKRQRFKPAPDFCSSDLFVVVLFSMSRHSRPVVPQCSRGARPPPGNSVHELRDHHPPGAGLPHTSQYMCVSRAFLGRNGFYLWLLMKQCVGVGKGSPF